MLTPTTHDSVTTAPTPIAPRRTLRLPQLDALRALAILLVLGRHFQRLPSEAHPLGRLLMSTWQRCGWIGVDLFFVLSGYLISGLLFREYLSRGTANVGRFLVRRALKIYPAFIALFVFACVWHLKTHDFSLRKAVIEGLFVQDYALGMWSHTWSLGVEEHFYLAAAFGVWLAIRAKKNRPFKGVPVVFAVIAIACLIARILTSANKPFDFFTQVSPTHLRADSLMFGVLLSYLDEFHHAPTRALLRRMRFPLLLLSIALISPAFVLELESTFMRTIGFTMLYLGFGGLMMLTLASPTMERSRAVFWLGRIGIYSYSIYLWHIACRHFVYTRYGQSPLLKELIIYVIVSLAVGILMSKAIEWPMLYLRDKILPSPVRSAVPLRADALAKTPPN